MGDGGNESVAITAGIWGFIVLFGLAIACWLLFRSMNNHLRKAQWQKEHDHPIRRRIRVQAKAVAPADKPADIPADTPAKAPDGEAEKP